MKLGNLWAHYLINLNNLLFLAQCIFVTQYPLFQILRNIFWYLFFKQELYFIIQFSIFFSLNFMPIDSVMDIICYIISIHYSWFHAIYLFIISLMVGNTQTTQIFIDYFIDYVKYSLPRFIVKSKENYLSIYIFMIFFNEFFHGQFDMVFLFFF